MSTQTKNSCMVLVNNSTQTTPPASLRRGMCYANCEDPWNTKKSLRSYLINEARFAKGLTGLNDQDVLLMSDYDEDFWDSGEEDDGSSTSDQWDADDEIEGEDDAEGEDDDEEEDESEAEGYDSVREDPRTASINEHNHRSSFLETSSFVYLKETPSPSATKSASFTGGLPKKEEPVSREVPKRPPQLPPPPASPLNNISTPRPPSKPEPPPHQRSLNSHDRQPVPPQRGLSLSYDSVPSSSPRTTPRSSPPGPKPSPAPSGQSLESTPTSALERKEPRKERPLKERKEKLSKEKKSKDEPDSNGQMTKQATKSANDKLEKGTKANHENKGSQIMEKFARENVARHIKRGVGNQLLKRRTSLKAMLSWSKNSIKQPMIATLISGTSTTRGDIKTEAINCFKLIQQYMGDRVCDRKDAKPKESIAFELISKACARQEMRDEIYVQLCRQTTDNPRKASIVSGKWHAI